MGLPSLVFSFYWCKHITNMHTYLPAGVQQLTLIQRTSASVYLSALYKLFQSLLWIYNLLSEDLTQACIKYANLGSAEMRVRIISNNTNLLCFPVCVCVCVCVSVLRGEGQCCEDVLSQVFKAAM